MLIINDELLIMKTVIIDYKAGNVQSLLFAIERLGFSAKITSNPDEIFKADKVIFPGVGEASFAMNSLRETKLDLLIPELKQPLLGICLGMQLLCKDSEESNTKALGIFDVSVKKFPDSVLVPQIGWNQIYDLKSDLFQGIPEQTYTYLVHSYYVAKNKHTIATTDYAEAYSTALQKDNFFGVQFHPEKSGILGSKILENFLKL